MALPLSYQYFSILCADHHFVVLFEFVQLRTKSDVASVGRLSLNLTGFTQETASIFGHQLHKVIKTLLPYSHTMPLTIEYLNTAMLQPKKDNQTGRYTFFFLSIFSCLFVDQVLVGNVPWSVEVSSHHVSVVFSTNCFSHANNHLMCTKCTTNVLNKP